MGFLSCPLCCGKKFSSRKSLKYHLLSVLENLYCSDCKQRFSNISALTTHLEKSCSYADNMVGSATEVCLKSKTEFAVCGDYPVRSVDTEVKSEGDVSAADIDGVTIVDSHFCSLCNKYVSSLPEHVGEHHSNEDVFYYQPDLMEGTEEVVCDGNNYILESLQEADDDDVLILSDDDQSNLSVEEIHIADDDGLILTRENFSSELLPSENTNQDIAPFYPPVSTVRIDPALEVHNYTVQTRPVCVPAQHESSKLNIVKVSKAMGLDCSPNEVIEPTAFITSKTTLTPNTTKVVRQYPRKASPKALDNKRKRKYAALGNIACYSKVVCIDKFWEDDPYVEYLPSSSKTTSDNTDVDIAVVQEAPIDVVEEGPAERKVARIMPQANMIRCPKVLPIDSNGQLQDLFESGATSTVHDLSPLLNDKRGLVKRFVLRNGSFVEDGPSVSGTGSEDGTDVSQVETLDTSDVMDGRIAILKFIKVCLEETVSMVPVYCCSRCKKEFGTFRGARCHWHVCKCPEEPPVSEARSSIKLQLMQVVSEDLVPETVPAKMETNKPEPKKKRSYASKSKKNVISGQPSKEKKIPEPKSKEQTIRVPLSPEKKMLKKYEKMLSDPHTCDICNSNFATLGGLKHHRKMHRPESDRIKIVKEMHNTVEYHCDLCTSVVYSRQAFGFHYLSHFPELDEINENLDRFMVQPEDLGKVSCKICWMVFGTNDDLKAHWMVHHPDYAVKGQAVLPLTSGTEESTEKLTAAESFTCDTCGKVFAENVREMHEKSNCSRFQFYCTDCSRPFGNQYDLDVHNQCHTIASSLKCRRCKLNFKDLASLRSHIKKHGDLLERPYACSFCGWRFKKANQKVKHEWVHTGYKPHECNICGHKFRTPYSLSCHKRIHTNIRPFACHQCGKMFRDNKNLLYHMTTHSNVRSFSCKKCTKTYKTAVALSNHGKSHTKPFSCTLCSRMFASLNTMRQHVASHSKTAMHKCDECDVMYGRKYMLKEHIATAHIQGLQPTVEMSRPDPARNVIHIKLVS